MLAARRQSDSFGWLIVLALVLAGAAFLTPAKYLGFYWAGIGGITLLILYAVFGDLVAAVLLWFFTLICLHEEFWRKSVPLFFNITIPRLFIVVLVVLLVMMLMLGRIRLHLAGAVGLSIFCLALYFSVSAAISGFETHSPVKVHYRLIGGYLFPFTAFLLVLNGVRTEAQIRRIAVFFLFVSVYLAFTGWMERFEIWSLVFPKFIADPSVGIHFGRVRGPFVQSAAMGLSLTFCYFSNLVLARQTSAITRWLIYALNVLMLPVIFWTQTRSVWLGFLLSCLVWFAYSKKRTIRAVWVAVLIAAASFVAVANFEGFLSEDRLKGGVTDVEPILVRLGLAQITWNMFEVRPFLGVGFGHFRDHAPNFAGDPSSPYYAFATTAMEHNNLLSILAETGLVGLVLYLLVLFLLVRMSFSLYRKLPRTAPGFINRDLIVLFWILAIAYLVDGFFRETSDNPFANSLFFGLSGVIVALDLMLGPRPLSAYVPVPAVPVSRPANLASQSGAADRPRPGTVS